MFRKGTLLFYIPIKDETQKECGQREGEKEAGVIGEGMKGVKT